MSKSTDGVHVNRFWGVLNLQTRRSRTWCLHFRLTVRRLMAAVLVLGAVFGWTALQAHIQQSAVLAIKNAGGTVTYDWESRSGKAIQGAKPWAPTWLADLLGVDYFGHVVAVSLHGQIDGKLQFVQRLVRLERLDISHSSASDAGLASIEDLTGLRELVLNHTRVTDNGLAHIERMTELARLHLGGNQITDSGLQHLRQATRLRSLDLDNTGVTDAGLEYLRLATELRFLNLGATQVTDNGMANLEDMTELSTLVLYLTQVTPDRIQGLRQRMPKLEFVIAFRR